MRSLVRRAGSMLTLLFLGTGCHRPPAVAPDVAPLPVSQNYEHCWNTVFRTDLPPDTVAVHFQRAFGALGLTNTTWVMRGDTTWAHGGPTRIDRETGGPATYEARVVAYRLGNSTHFRHFVSVTPPPEGWAAGSDSGIANGRRYGLSSGTRQIAFCGDLGPAARVHGTAARDPDPEVSLELWNRAPY
jgi:hypothetical protein